MCIICFLTDLNQYNLRKSSQYRSDRFEHSLKVYKQSFVVNFQKSLKSKLCKLHDNDNNMKIKGLLCKINIEDIKGFFDILLEVYFLWIDGKSSESINKLNKLLEKYNMLDNNIDDIHNNIFFRGRTCEKFISHWDMFHIPFNKRFIIANQRYSLIGQPLLYLAKSPIGVINELDCTKNLRISTFRFTSKNKIKIFDNTNKFYNLIEDNNIGKDVSDIIDYKSIQYNNKINIYLFHLIISGCCSFEKRGELKEYGFCEEYVLPQILAQLLKISSFDGILYTSTKAPYKFSCIDNTKVYDLFSCNLALFTKYDKEKIYDETYVYDKELYSKFKISSPILFEDKLCFNICNNEEQITKLKDDDISNYLKYNQSLIQDLIENGCIDRLNEQDKNVIVKISDLNVAYKQILTSEDTYKQYIYGIGIKEAIKLHFFMLQNIILNIRDFYICIKEE